MNENCKDCIQIGNIEDKIKSLWHATNEIKDQNKDFEKRINELEIANSENKKDFKRAFDDIAEIKNSLKDIATAIKNMQSQPVQNYEKIKWILITAFASSLVGAVITFMAKG
jgi:septal ring factor EnvC (AmiA/AmiB activator)